MKNRILKFVFAVGLSLTLTMSCIPPVFTYAAETEEVNEDGKIDVRDAAKMAEFNLGLRGI